MERIPMKSAENGEKEEQLESTTESNRIFLLKVARILDKAIAEELEHDLKNQ